VRVYLDTNVLVSTFTTRGLCADLMRLILAEHDLMTGEANLGELRRVLTDRFGAATSVIASVESQLRDQIVLSTPGTTGEVPVRDPDDAWVLASALSSNAELLVTGDRDLLALSALVELPIVTPRTAWKRLHGMRQC